VSDTGRAGSSSLFSQSQPSFHRRGGYLSVPQFLADNSSQLSPEGIATGTKYVNRVGAVPEILSESSLYQWICQYEVQGPQTDLLPCFVACEINVWSYAPINVLGHIVFTMLYVRRLA
jgi:hypothetical protein